MENSPKPGDRCQLDGILWEDHQTGFNHEFSQDGQLRPLKSTEDKAKPVVRVLIDLPLRAALINKGLLTAAELAKEDEKLYDSADRSHPQAD